MTRQNKCKYINLDSKAVCIDEMYSIYNMMNNVNWKERDILQPDYILKLSQLMTKTEDGQRINPEQINYIMIYYARDVICVKQHVK